MEEYLRNILPRLRRHSSQLNRIEMFIERPWLKFNDNNRVEYTFERNKTLIISTNGDAQVGTWELLSTGKLLIQKPNGDEQLEPQFLNDNLFILSKPNSEDQLSLLINEQIVNSNFSIENFINNFLTYQENRNTTRISTESAVDWTNEILVASIIIIILILLILSGN